MFESDAPGIYKVEGDQVKRVKVRILGREKVGGGEGSRSAIPVMIMKAQSASLGPYHQE